MCRVFVSAELLANCSIACVGGGACGGWAGHGAGVRGPGEYVRVIGDQRPVFIYLSLTVYKSKLMLINVLH